MLLKGKCGVIMEGVRGRLGGAPIWADIGLYMAGMLHPLTNAHTEC